MVEEGSTKPKRRLTIHVAVKRSGVVANGRCLPLADNSI
jgi:hypothetical protein